ncbi:hypothetical protein PHMEG_00021513 [Phytophthora megakarya]|uniref:Uncharacterized protein n=1 Tax=Phytophthora megakarya TaxID=4795 RepID=A0A225VMX8_9STRA|nr:hypothetical protein PHMEG_00021513 [Phytophthora megakarya]
MKMETLAYLARSDSSDSGDDFASTGGRPTPLDPEYWRGITHSIPAPTAAYRPPSQMQPPSQHYAHQYAAPMYQSQPQQRLMTSPPMMQSYGGAVLTSPIHHLNGSPVVPVSPVARIDTGHDASYLMHSGVMVDPQARSYSATVAPLATPQQLKILIREALVRAQAYLDLVPFFQSYDLTFAGGVRLGTIQQALGRMGVILRDHVLQNIGQLFSIPGSGLVDYVALGRFLELDAQELDNLRSMVAARRSVLVNSGIDLGDIFAQYDAYRTGFVSRGMFATLLRDYSIILPETTLHFLMIQLAKPTDTTSISYVRFLEMTDVGVARSASANSSNNHTLELSPPRLSSWTGGRPHAFDHENPARGYEMQTVVPIPAQAARVVDHASASPDFATPLPRLGWVCRVCAHQQIADWATHCEICETSKPRPGLRGEGYIKCLNCKFDNNYDLDECEMCGRPLNASNKKMSRSEKKRKSKKRHVSSSSSSSSSLSSSSSSDHRRKSRRKSERRSRSVRSSRKKGEKKPRFQRGEEIQAIPLGERGYEVGVITRVRPNGRYDIEFDNGLYEKNVEESCILEISRARVIRARDLSDEEETKKKPKPKDSDEDHDPGYESGDRIEARFEGKERYFAGTIKKCRTGGLYDIEYDDGEVELRVRPKYIKRGETKKPRSPPLKEDVVSISEVPWAKGQKVEAKLRGYADYVRCIVFRAHEDGSCDVELETGELEKRVLGRNIRTRASSPVKKAVILSEDEPIHPKKPVVKRASSFTTSDDSSAQPKSRLKQGQMVEAKRNGNDGYSPGVITRCRLNGSYDVDFDDGEKVLAVPAIDVRRMLSTGAKTTATNIKKDSYTVGQSVEAQYKGKSKFYPGVISRCRLNGTYDIDYDDGEKETGVAPELIRLLGKKGGGDSDDDPRQKKFKEGDKVEAQYKGKSKFYPGVISRCRLNGTYDIDYDDGEKETGVAPELIRLLGKKGGGDSDDDPRQKKFKEGDKVEAQYKGKSKFYPGVISRCRLNGTYDIDYDDGEKETGVAPELMRLIRTASFSRDASSKDSFSSRSEAKGESKLVVADSIQVYRVGTRVEALYMGKDKYFKGTISRVNADGTYAIEYDDGDKENRVASSSIRPLKSQSSFRGDDFAVGKPVRPSSGGSFRRRSGNSSD